MNRRRSLYWKIGYLAAMIPLLMLTSWLARPAAPGAGHEAGKLARLREEHGLAQTRLGEIDPASETMKLATLGMRGVAVHILWLKAIDYQKKKDWTNLGATAQQIAKLEPHFVSVWRYQCWNLSYNVSVEFDDYRERYRWVMRGIEFLGEGIRHNQREPVLVWDTGWFTSQKIGRSDERALFRPMFKKDDDFHDKLPYFAQDPTRDNWLVGKRWFRRVLELVREGARMRGTSPVVYHSDPPMCQMNYSEAIEGEGTFGEAARRAWRQASREWYEFGKDSIPTSFGVNVRLNDLDTDPDFDTPDEKERSRDYQRIAREAHEQLRALHPELTETLLAQRRAVLTRAQREALEVPADQRTSEQSRLAGEAEQLLRLSNQDIARRVKGELRQRAQELAKRGDEAEETATIIRRYRDIVNFDFWRERAKMEQREETVRARELLYRGKTANESGDLIAARDAYREGLALWRQVLDRHPAMIENAVLGDDLLEVIGDYRRLLNQLDEPFDPETFILKDILEKHSVDR